MAIDLSKLKALELPKKEISAEVLGETQKLTISAYGDDTALSISDICENYKSDSERRVWCMLLEECANMTKEDAELYISMDLAGASGVVNQIHKLTAEFRKMRKEAREAAKKKSNPAN